MVIGTHQDPQSVYTHGETAPETDYVSPPKRTTPGRRHDSNEEQLSLLKPLRDATVLQSNNMVIRNTRLSPLKKSLTNETEENDAENIGLRLSPRRLFIRDNSNDISSVTSRDRNTNSNVHVDSNFNLPTGVDNINKLVPPERSDTTVGWGKRKMDGMSDEEDRETNKQEDQRSILQREKRKYMKTEHKNSRDEQDEFGPTQISTAKDIFE